jgi:hypothetical protein
MGKEGLGHKGLLACKPEYMFLDIRGSADYEPPLLLSLFPLNTVQRYIHGQVGAVKHLQNGSKQARVPMWAKRPSLPYRCQNLETCIDYKRDDCGLC